MFAQLCPMSEGRVSTVCQGIVSYVMGCPLVMACMWCRMWVPIPCVVYVWCFRGGGGGPMSVFEPLESAWIAYLYSLAG